MAWGVDDLRKFVEGLANTFEGGTGMPMQVGNQNVQDAIVKPGKLLSDFSGVTQGVKGVDPKASNMDRGLALLTLAGMLGGQEAAMGLKSALTPEYAYGIHVNSENISKLGKKIKPIKDSESRYGKGASSGMNAFFGFGKEPNLIPDKALENAVKWGTSYDGGSASLVKTKAKNITKDPRSSVGWKTPKNLKVIKSTPYNFSAEDPYWQEMIDQGDVLLTKDLLKKLITKTQKTTP